MRTINREIVGAFIISTDQKVLLGKSNRATYEGCWIIPGGGIEVGETAVQALNREIFEEVGLDISNMKKELIDLKLTGQSEKVLKETGERVLGKYKFTTYVIRLKAKSANVKIIAGDDFEQVCWHATTELKNLKLPAPSIKNLRYLGLYD